VAKERRRGSCGRASAFVVVIAGLLLAAGESDGDEPASVLYSGDEGGARESTSRRKNLYSDFAARQLDASHCCADHKVGGRVGPPLRAVEVRGRGASSRRACPKPRSGS
jgi:hypothetical protein